MAVLHYFKMLQERALLQTQDLASVIQNERAGLSPHAEGALRQKLQGMGLGYQNVDIVHYGKDGQVGQISLNTRADWQRLGWDPTSETQVDNNLEKLGKPKISSPSRSR